MSVGTGVAGGGGGGPVATGLGHARTFHPLRGIAWPGGVEAFGSVSPQAGQAPIETHAYHRVVHDVMFAPG